MVSGRLMSMDEARGDRDSSPKSGTTPSWRAGRSSTRSSTTRRSSRRRTRPACAVGRIKRAVQSGLEAGFGEGLALERELQQLLFQSDDAKEGIAANLEKRKPNFKGQKSYRARREAADLHVDFAEAGCD